MRRNDRFLWVKFQLDAICTEISDNGIEKALEKVPDDMDATYERILGTINHKPRAQRELARKILIWVAYARQPLPIDSLAYAISIEMSTKSLEDLNSAIPTEKSILDVCANLISVDSSKNRYVRFVHFSVQEFLKSHGSTTLNIEYEVSHREIAQTCMIFLSLFPKRSEDKLHQYTFNQWPHHLLAGNLTSRRIDDQIVTLASSFFETGPLLFTEQPIPLFSSMETAYLKFSPSALALTFDLPGTYGRLLENKKSKTIYLNYNNQDFPVLADDNLVIHYATAELDSVPVAQRLYRHGYSLKYSYINSYTTGTTVPNWLQLSPLYSVQNIQMARYLLDNGTRIQPQYLRGRYFDPLTYFVCQTNWGSEVIRRLLDGVVDQDDRRLENTLHISEDESRIDVNAQGGEYGNALQAAAYHSNLEAIQLLLDKGAEVNAQGGEYGNALQAAAYDGNLEVVQLLLDKGAEVNAEGGHYGNALQAAAYEGSLEVIQLLLDKGAEVNAQGGHYGNALQAAAFRGKLEVIQLLLDKGAEVNAQGERYGNALQAAAYDDNLEVVQLLLDKGAEVNAQGGYHGNALQAAAYREKLEYVQLLLDKGAEVNAQGGHYGNALQAAAYYGNLKVVQLLLDKGAEVNAQGGPHGNALQAAAYDGRLEVVQLLLDKGAEVNAQGGYYGNALQAAAYRGILEVTQLLLDEGAEVKAQGGFCGNALQAAACGRNSKAVQLLLDQGVDIHTQGGVFGSALQAAATYGHIEVIQLLLDNGANVNIQGGIFGTVLQAAAHSGKFKCIQLLLDKGANFNTRSGKYGAALKKMLALEPMGTDQKVPGDVPLLAALVQDHGPNITEYYPGSDYDEYIRDTFCNEYRCSLDVFRKILESRGWKREAQDSEGESDILEAEQEPDKNENENDDRNTATIEDEVGDGGGAGAENETSQELQKSLLEARLDSSPKATARVWKLLGFTFLVYLLYIFIQLL